MSPVVNFKCRLAGRDKEMPCPVLASTVTSRRPLTADCRPLLVIEYPMTRVPFVEAEAFVAQCGIMPYVKFVLGAE
jgi:hypothetical protein